MNRVNSHNGVAMMRASTNLCIYVLYVCILQQFIAIKSSNFYITPELTVSINAANGDNDRLSELAMQYRS